MNDLGQRDAQMDFTLSERQTTWRDRVRSFMHSFVYPAVPAYDEHLQSEGISRWSPPPVIEELKARAFAEGLWNLFLPPSAPLCMQIVDHDLLLYLTGSKCTGGI